MIPPPSEKDIQRLQSQQVIWLASVRPDGRPHLVPIWFVWLEGKIYLGTDPASVKVRNLRANPEVSLALEDGVQPLICEGSARLLEEPIPDEVLSAFRTKYEWDVKADAQYHLVVEITPRKWLAWSDPG
jgi:PPOX class probable F420-dependent enzyme